MSASADLVVAAQAALRAPSTHSDYAERLQRGIRLLRRHEAAGARLLRETLAELAVFRHVRRDSAGDVTLSMYARGLVDAASWHADEPAIAEALRLLEFGDEDGVAALESALAERERV